MSFIRSERVASVALLIAAALGLIVANSAIGSAAIGVQESHLAIPGIGLDLTIGHWISDLLLAVFFFVVAIELKHELIAGELNSVRKAVRPAIAAVGGAVVPIIIYFAFTIGTEYARGWPIPTATDIAFALGVLAVFGKGMPGRLRVFLLALAIIDDIIAIIIIAVFFTTAPNLILLGVAILVVALFGYLSRFLKARMRTLVVIALIVLAMVAWYLVYLSGVHATIAGVALGLAMAHRPGVRLRHTLEPFSNGIVLPIFAFSAALVVIPQVAIGDLTPPFWGILVALPVGKLIGIMLGGWLSTFLSPKKARPHLSMSGLATAGLLGGIGFTVSLLMNQLAFDGSPQVLAEGTLAVLLGSMVSVVASAILVSQQAAHYRKIRELRIAARGERADTGELPAT